jgi:hypothetical protein
MVVNLTLVMPTIFISSQKICASVHILAGLSALCSSLSNHCTTRCFSAKKDSWPLVRRKQPSELQLASDATRPCTVAAASLACPLTWRSPALLCSGQPQPAPPATWCVPVHVPGMRSLQRSKKELNWYSKVVKQFYLKTLGINLFTRWQK